jgi:hypothetical protein
MECRRIVQLGFVVVTTAFVVGLGAWAAAEEEPAQAGEKVGVEGTFVRVAENQEGWVVLGYRIANESVGQEWMLIDLGMTVQKGVENQTITRDQVKLVTPDHQVISLPTQPEYEKAAGSLALMEKKATEFGDSINFFPPAANMACRIGFFTDTRHPERGAAFEQAELDSNRACVGRVYFHLPDGIQYGNYNVDVKFANSILKVPMEIMDKERTKEFEKQWKKAKKEAKHQAHDH